LMFYATWSRGFRPGGINRRGDIPPYDADFLSNWELGWKTTLADGRLRWNGAIFHEKWKQFQFAFLGANSFTEIHNGTDAKINGIETDVAYSFEGFSLTASAAYTDAKTKGNICGGVDDTTNDCSLSFVSVPSGRRLPITPKFKGAATGRYTWHVFDDAKAHVQAGIAYQGSAPATLRTLIPIVGAPATLQDPNTWLGKVKASTVFDLAAGIDWSRWSAELYASNLFDEDIELTRGVACGSCMRTLIVPGTPRTIGLRVGAKF
jgi:iron complex outermembrane receptor protein